MISHIRYIDLHMIHILEGDEGDEGDEEDEEDEDEGEDTIHTSHSNLSRWNQHYKYHSPPPRASAIRIGVVGIGRAGASSASKAYVRLLQGFQHWDGVTKTCIRICNRPIPRV
jgi:hypothetical protein